MKKFKKKPVIIEAVRYNGDVGAHEITSLDLGCERDNINNYDILVISTLEGEMIARPGDWIIRGIKGELYPCRNDIFEATYEAVE